MAGEAAHHKLVFEKTGDDCLFSEKDAIKNGDGAYGDDTGAHNGKCRVRGDLSRKEAKEAAGEERYDTIGVPGEEDVAGRDEAAFTRRGVCFDENLDLHVKEEQRKVTQKLRDSNQKYRQQSSAQPFQFHNKIELTRNDHIIKQARQIISTPQEKMYFIPVLND